jgi:hypothetical protein
MFKDIVEPVWLLLTDDSYFQYILILNLFNYPFKT